MGGERGKECLVDDPVVCEAQQHGSGQPGPVPSPQHMGHLSAVPPGADDDDLVRHVHGPMVADAQVGEYRPAEAG